MYNNHSDHASARSLEINEAALPKQQHRAMLDSPSSSTNAFSGRPQDDDNDDSASDADSKSAFDKPESPSLSLAANSLPTESHDEGPLSSQDVEKEAAPAGTTQAPALSKDPNLIEWDGPDDPENPMNWPLWKKWMITAVLGSMTFVITFASSVFSTATVVTSVQFGVSTEVMTLGTSLVVLGYAFGPMVWGPVSEVYGRKYPLFFGFFVFAIFQIPVAVAQNVETIMLCRFFAGFFGSAPLAIIAGAFVDFWNPVDRGVAVVIFAGATMIGPVGGPIIGGFVTMSHLGWRWTAYLTAILAFSFGIPGFILVPETFHPLLLQRRARKIRLETRNWAIHARADETEVNLKVLARQYLVKPFAMLFQELILILMTLYIALIYGILYLFFTAYPIAFQRHRGWNGGVGALPFLAILIGVLIGGALVTYTTKTRFARKMEKHGRVIPEERLIPMMVGAVIFPAGLFWFAWTSDPSISWVPQVLSGIFAGAGIFLIFLQGMNYIIDCYLMNANSAMASNTFVRSLLGAAFPMFATYMYNKLGVDWATSLLGFLTAALIPVPILFYFYGARIRKQSRYSPNF